MRTPNRRLLLLACSRRKRVYADLLPAIDRYDGPLYRVLRRSLSTSAAQGVDTYILSAEFGLLPSCHLIPDYDRRMTPERARQLRPDVITALGALLTTNSYDEIFICMGRAYLQALDEYQSLIPPAVVIHVVAGSLGRQSSQLHDWLNGGAPEQRDISQYGTAGHVRIRGIEVQAVVSDVLAVARGGAESAAPGAQSYHSWYVPIGDWRVAPKWLVSQISGLPVSDFSTDAARRLLSQLGIEVKRV